MVALNVSPVYEKGLTEIHVIGRAQTGKVTWDDMCQNPHVRQAGGTIEKLHGVFEMRVVLDTNGQPLKAKWSHSAELNQ